jgi:hypothetical protein
VSSGYSFTPSEKSLQAKKSQRTISTNYTPAKQRVDAARLLAMKQKVSRHLLRSPWRRTNFLTNILNACRLGACEH